MGLQLMGQFRYLAGIEFDCRTQNVNDIPWYEWHEQSCPQFETLRCSLGPLSGRQRKTWKSAREFRWISLIWMKSITKSMRCCDSSFPFEAALLKVALRVGVSEQGKDFRRVPAICTVSEIDPMLYRASVSRSVLYRTACIIVRKYIYMIFIIRVMAYCTHTHNFIYNNCIHIMNMLIHIIFFCNYKCFIHSDSLSFLQLNSQMLGTVVCGTPCLMIFQQMRRILMMLVSGDDLHGRSRMIWRANCGVPWHRTAQTSKNDVEFWPMFHFFWEVQQLHGCMLYRSHSDLSFK